MASKALTPGTATRASAKRRIRKIFGDIHEVVQMPNLIEVQRESYEQFLRSDPATGYVSGLEKTLRSVFPIRDFAGTSELDFVHYELEEPKYDTTECRQRGITYAATPPKGSTIASGEWWAADYSGKPLVSFARDVADGFVPPSNTGSNSHVARATSTRSRAAGS